MRIPIDPTFAAKAKELGLPIYRIQIDWSHVPKDRRTLKSHESCGFTSLEQASEMMRLSLEDFIEKTK